MKKRTNIRNSDVLKKFNNEMKCIIFDGILIRYQSENDEFNLKITQIKINNTKLYFLWENCIYDINSWQLIACGDYAVINNYFDEIIEDL